MFSFHRPRIFKSVDGCCICKAKSSSSRFTCSAKYESSFTECFDLYNEDRSGDICNACVLLVKRFWKKRNGQSWSHVVDARSGPGTRSMMRIRKNRMKKKKEEEIAESESMDVASSPQNPPIPEKVDNINESSDEEQHCTSRSRRSKIMKDESHPIKISPFLDLSFWRRKDICCGTVFIGANNELMIDQNLLHRCNSRSPSRASDGASDDACMSSDSQTPSPVDASLNLCQQML